MGGNAVLKKSFNFAVRIVEVSKYLVQKKPGRVGKSAALPTICMYDILALIILWANFDYRIMKIYRNSFNGRRF